MGCRRGGGDACYAVGTFEAGEEAGWVALDEGGSGYLLASAGEGR